MRMHETLKQDRVLALVAGHEGRRGKPIEGGVARVRLGERRQGREKGQDGGEAGER